MLGRSPRWVWVSHASMRMAGGGEDPKDGPKNAMKTVATTTTCHFETLSLNPTARHADCTDSPSEAMPRMMFFGGHS